MFQVLCLLSAVCGFLLFVAGVFCFILSLFFIFYFLSLFTGYFVSSSLYVFIFYFFFFLFFVSKVLCFILSLRFSSLCCWGILFHPLFIGLLCVLRETSATAVRLFRISVDT